MRWFFPLFVVSVALRAAVTDGAGVPAAPIPTSEAIFQHNEVLTPGHMAFPQRHRGEYARSALLGVGVLLVTVAVVSWALQCFKGLHSNMKASNFGVNKRRAAEGSSNPCGVCLGQHKHGIPLRTRCTPGKCRGIRNSRMRANKSAAQMLQGDAGKVLSCDPWFQVSSRTCVPGSL